MADTTNVRRFDADYFFSADFSRLARRDRELLNHLARRTRRAMNDLGESPQTFGLIHGDLGPANWVFLRGEARPIDFDEFGVGYFLFDLVQVLWTHSMWPDYDAHMSRLLESYESVRALDDPRTPSSSPLPDTPARRLDQPDGAAPTMRPR